MALESMMPHFGSVTEPSAAPNSTSTSARVMFCRPSDAACAASPLGALMLMLTVRFPSPSLSATDTVMSEGSKSAPSSFARAARRLLATEEL
eukprot:scaffold122810_cov63-Phaeocystis_antarctica.AAC.1